MDKLQRTVQQEHESQAQNGNGGFDVPADAGIDHPALKAHADRMTKAYQRSLQQVKDRERDLDRQLQQFAITQSQQPQYPQAARQSEAQPEDFDWLDPEVKPLLNNPDAAHLRGLLRSIEKRTAPRDNSEVSEMRETVRALQQQLQQTQASMTQDRIMRQIPDFRQKFGRALDEDQQRQVLERSLSYGEDLETALLNTNRDVFLAQQRSVMEAELKAKYAAEYGAQLDGFDDIRSSEPQTNRKPVDANGKMASFRETALDVLGKGGMMQAMRDGFTREETVTQEE